ncbi:MAG: hypothetical protein R2874_10575 [Desulfobacterales bacterium]
MDVEEFYDASGKLVRLSEYEPFREHPSLVWFYDDSENPVRAEQDTTDSGTADVWFFYEDGRATRVEEDSNHDGKVDLWEYYDGAEALIRREKDYDFDGKSDVIEDLREKDASQNACPDTTSPADQPASN